MKILFEKFHSIKSADFLYSSQVPILSKISRICLSLSCILLFFGMNDEASGHSHVWIHGSVIIHFDKDGLSGFKEEWVFDEMFSNMIIHDYDKDQNGMLESDEVKEVYDGAFTNLKNYKYFTHVKINGKPFEVKFIKDFTAKIVKDRVVYHFFVPCHVKAASSFKEIRIGIYDESFYSNVTLLHDQIFFKNETGYEYDHKIEKNKEDPYYYGQVYPEEIVLRFREKNE